MAISIKTHITCDFPGGGGGGGGGGGPDPISLDLHMILDIFICEGFLTSVDIIHSVQQNKFPKS